MSIKLTKIQQKVFSLVKKIPKGKTSTYKEIAIKLRTSPRAVGRILRTNKNPKIPCHRVIRSDGKIGGYRGRKNSKLKQKLLKAEGMKIMYGKLKKEIRMGCH